MADFPTGKGGQKRADKIDSMVAEIAGRVVKQDPAYTAPKVKPAYKATEQEKKTRTYGAPIQPPITRMRRGQSTDSMNRYA